MRKLCSLLCTLVLFCGQIQPCNATEPKKGVEQTVVFAMKATDGSLADSLTVTASVSKDGGALVLSTNSVAEIGSGLYKLVLTATEMTADEVAIRCGATGAKSMVITLYTPDKTMNDVYTDMSTFDASSDTVANVGTVATVTNGVIVTTNNDKSDYIVASGTITDVTNPVDVANTDDCKADVSGLATSVALATAQADLDNPDQYKANVSGLSTFDSSSDMVTVTVNNDKTGYSLASDQSTVTIGVTNTVTNGVIVTTNNDKTGYTVSSGTITDITNPVTIGTNNDKTGYYLASTQTFNMSGNVAGSVGSVSSAVTIISNSDITAIKNKTDNLPTDPADESLIIAEIQQSESDVRGGTDTLKTLSDQLDMIPTTIPSSLTATDVWTFHDRDLSVPVATESHLQELEDKIDLIPTTYGSTLTAQQVWEYATRTLTAFSFTPTCNVSDKTGYSLSSSGISAIVAALNNITAADVWAYSTRTLSAFAFTPSISTASVNDITNSVRNGITADHGSGSYVSSSGSGVNTVSIDVINSTTSVAIDGVNVYIYDSTNATLLYQGTTNVSGRKTFYLDSATYKVRLYRATFTANTFPETLPVSADTTATYRMFSTSTTGAPIGSVPLCRVYLTVFDSTGSVYANVKVRNDFIVFTDSTLGTGRTPIGGGTISNFYEEKTTDSNGQTYFDVVRGADYYFRFTPPKADTWRDRKTIPNSSSVNYEDI